MICYRLWCKKEAVQILKDSLAERCRGWIVVLEVLLHQHSNPSGSVRKHLWPLIVGKMRRKVRDLSTCIQLPMLHQ